LGAVVYKIPTQDVIALERELLGLQYGVASLEIVIRNGKYQFSRITKAYTYGGHDNTKVSTIPENVEETDSFLKEGRNE
jgi:hypothetical protein